MNKNKKIILVTGAGGYIGSMLVPSLLKSGFRVRAIDRFFFGNNLKSNKNLKIIYDDIRNLKSEYFKSVYGVIDLAAISNDPSGEKFKKQTYEINYKARVRNAILSKKNKVIKYLLPSSCSNYGKIPTNVIADENYKLNPLTNYSKANSKAEKDILKLSSEKFCSTVFRQGTVYGFSPKMRFDLAINGMTYGCYKNNILPIMRNGMQRRPMLHIKDAIRAMKFFLKSDSKIFSGEIFNIGSESNNYRIIDLANKLKLFYGRKLKLEWYGNADKRSYFVSFEKIRKAGFKTLYQAEDGIKEIHEKLVNKKIEKNPNTITLNWYEYLEYMDSFLNQIKINGKLLKK